MEDLNKHTSERARERGLMKSKSCGSKGCPERRPFQHKYQGLLRTLGSTGARKEKKSIQKWLPRVSIGGLYADTHI